MSEPQNASFELSFPLERYPGINPFALDYVRGAGIAHKFLHPGSWHAAARDAALVSELVESNAAWGNDVAAAVREWSRGESAGIIAGQQVGFGGGPLYTLAKIASMLRLRREVEASGKKATVFFWLATEDHDYDEVSRLTLWQHDRLHHLRATERPRASYAVGALPLPDSLRREYADITGEQPDWLSEGLSLRDSFARLLSEALAGQGVVLIDSLLPSLRRAGASLFLSIFDRHAELQQALAKRTAEIRQAGYTPQIEAHEEGDFGLLHLLLDDGQRAPLRFDGAAWRVGDEQITSADLRARIAAQPERVSTGAMVRPLLQDLVFNSHTFVGGPAEVAYYAQASVLHELLGVNQPQVQLRGHALVAPQKRLRVLERYGIDPVALFDGVDSALAPLERGRLAEGERIVDAARDSLLQTTRALDSLLGEVDESVRASVARSERHLAYHLQRLGERTRRAVSRRDRERHDALTKTALLLAPDGEPQDRVLGWISFWRMYGNTLIERLIDAVEPNQAVVKIVGM
jgi:bacillithiol biosynthesis cysteine-adding enzyme BshC